MTMKMRPLLLTLAFVVTACATPSDAQTAARLTDEASPRAEAQQTAAALQSDEFLPPAEDAPSDVDSAQAPFDLVQCCATFEADADDYVWRQLLGLDDIFPVYEPEFDSADEAPLNDDELVLGISFEGQSKAYPITVMRFREIAIDELAGIPILVTW